MPRFAKLSVQVPESMRKRYIELEYGYKQLACTSGLIMYFNADEETQRLYRIWAQDIAEGYATLESPTSTVADALAKLAQKNQEEALETPPRRKKRGK